MILSPEKKYRPARDPIKQSEEFLKSSRISLRVNKIANSRFAKKKCFEKCQINSIDGKRSQQSPFHIFKGK
ncbi:CLUMA_CG000572, isoform A [Clunio marinus]|uniref:CLUMA_CG000572, isoform A n=1 Tax=Clunio marinus TaxID=568069 RepID=A0A1J1HFV6_9DIPT|nr:CLUMA_CG000572, isoform A [Clunio marinus]